MEPEMTWQRVEEAVASASLQGTVGVAISGPDGACWQHHGQRKFMAASTAKIPVMIEIFRQIDRGERALDDRYETEEADKSPGSGVLTHMRSGVHLSLYDLLYLMISISDNMATNILIDMAGMAAINTTMQELGMSRSHLTQYMRGLDKDPSKPENLATPNDYVTVIGSILDGKAASAEACEQMTTLLSKQQNGRRLARYIPRSNAIRWGSKTGTVPGVANDAGYIISPNGRLVIAVFTEQFADTHVAEFVIGDIARAAMADTGVVGPLYTS